MPRSAEQVKAKVCGKKTPHPDPPSARRAAASLNKTTNGKPYSHYRCPVCHQWHVGHVPSMRTLQEVADLIRGRLE